MTAVLPSADGAAERPPPPYRPRRCGRDDRIDDVVEWASRVTERKAEAIEPLGEWLPPSLDESVGVEEQALTIRKRCGRGGWLFAPKMSERWDRGNRNQRCAIGPKANRWKVPGRPDQGFLAVGRDHGECHRGHGGVVAAREVENVEDLVDRPPRSDLSGSEGLSRAMVVAASMPWPLTSPTTRTMAVAVSITSNQSPPT